MGGALVAVAGASSALVALSGMLLGLCWAGIAVYAFLGAAPQPLASAGPLWGGRMWLATWM